MNASYQASLVNRHIRRFTGIQNVDTYVRTAHCEFQRVWIIDVSLTGSQTLENAIWGQVT